jgi:hypothetical protein
VTETWWRQHFRRRAFNFSQNTCLSILDVLFYTITRVTFPKQPANMTRRMSFLPHACTHVLAGSLLFVYNASEKRGVLRYWCCPNDIRMI